MDLRVVDPKSLLDNPNNPRTSAPRPDADRRLAHNIKVVGLLHPPLVREQADGRLMIIAGHRRRRACVLAKMREMHVLVAASDAKLDTLVAGSENIIREAMTQSEQWRFVETMRHDKALSDTQLCRALMVTPAYLKRLSLLAGLHAPILHAIDLGRGPEFDGLKVIAAAPLEDQRAVWAEIFQDAVEEDADPADYHLSAEDPEDRAPWYDIVRALRQTRYWAVDARFDQKIANVYGIAWTEDLFAEGDQDNRFTEDARAYEAAQEHWLTQCLPEGSLRLEVGDYRNALLPEGYQRVQTWMGTQESDVTGYFLNPNTLKIDTIMLRMTGAEPGTSMASPHRPLETVAPAPKERADISGTGQKMVGTVRTLALHAALDAAVANVDPWDLVAALVLAFDADNVQVHTPEREHYGTPSRRRLAVAGLFPDGLLVRDPALLRQEAIAVLKNVANCTLSQHSGSGLPAQIMGLLFHADAHIPSMADEEFLKTFSKPGITKALQALGLAPRDTGKAMRAALLAHVGPQGRWVPEAAGFAQALAPWADQMARLRDRQEAADLEEDEDQDQSFDDADFETDQTALLDDADAQTAQAHDDTSSQPIEEQDDAAADLKAQIIARSVPDQDNEAAAFLSDHLEVVLVA